MRKKIFLFILFFIFFYGCFDFRLRLNDRINSIYFNSQHPMKFVFSKKTSVYWGYESDRKLHHISSESLERVKPAWSPDGSKILFAKPGIKINNQSSVADLVVVDQKNNKVNEIPVLTGWVDGVYIEGLRVIEEIGWLDEKHVFVSGSVNPNVVEFRLFDLVKGTEDSGHLGTLFTTCYRYGKVAFFDYAPNRDYYSLVVDDHEIFRLKKNAEDHVIRNLKWVDDCKKIALVDFSQNQSSLLVIDDKGFIDKKIELPFNSIFEARYVFDGLLLSNSNISVFIDFKDYFIYSIDSFPEKIKKITNLEKNLGILSADWYFPI